MIPARTSGTKQRPTIRAGSRDRLGLGRTVGQPGKHRVLDRLGNARLADGEAVRPRIVTQRTKQLLDMERDPVGPFVHGSRNLARSGQTRIEDQSGHESRVGW